MKFIQVVPVLLHSKAQMLDEYVASQTAPVWALIDGVNCKELPNLTRNGIGVGLYKPSSKADPTYAPWLLRLEPNSPRIQDLAMLPPDTHWGCLFSSQQALEALRTHFRRFTMMWIDGRSGAPVYFRFYDPRVLMDCFHALTPEHLAALLSPVQSLALPLSPLLGTESGISPLAARRDFRGKVIPVDCSGLAGADARSFRISAQEFHDFSEAQKIRAGRKLARELHGMFPQVPPEDLIDIANKAPSAAAVYGLTSIRQVRLYAECMCRYGTDFDRRDPQAYALLTRPDSLAWRKAKALEGWMQNKTQTSSLRHSQESW